MSVYFIIDNIVNNNVIQKLDDINNINLYTNIRNLKDLELILIINMIGFRSFLITLVSVILVCSDIFYIDLQKLIKNSNLEDWKNFKD